MKVLVIVMLFLPITTNSQVITDISYTKPNTDTEKTDTNSRTVSNGYFSWEPTGNVQEDAKRIELAAEEFKEKHPDIYKAICCDTLVLKIPYSEFELMDKEKQQLIISNPHRFRIIPVKK